MIKPSQIVTHLGNYLPRVTDLFNNTMVVLSAVVGAGNILTVTTAIAHGLSIGSAVSITAGEVNTPITGVSLSGDTALFETTVDHDLTEPRAINDLKEITLSGFTDNDWNGLFDINAVPNRLNFEVLERSGAAAPTLNGNEIMIAVRTVSVFGIQVVATVPTTTTITIQLASDVPDMSSLTMTDLKMVTAVRVSASSDIDRAEEMYTKYANQKLWAFVIMTDLDVSKDRHSINDAVATFSLQDEMSLRLLQNFSIVIFFPTSDSLTGATAQELAYGEVYQSLLNILYGFTGFATSDDGSQFATISSGHGRGIYKKAYYTQVFDWQTPVDITIDNGFIFPETVAFRNLNGTLPINTLDNEEQLTLAINLDDQPL